VTSDMKRLETTMKFGTSEQLLLKIKGMMYPP
jgi:hypothetical protein